MTTLNARANAAYHALIEDWNREHPDWEWMGFDHQRDAYETGWEDGYKAARQEAGQEGMGGDESCSASGIGDDSALPQEGEQASGDLLARLEAIQASRQTDAERFAVGLCIAALGEGAAPLLDREAVEAAIATKVMYYDSATTVHEVDDGDLAGLTAGTDAVMKLARSMPTREQIADGLRGVTDVPYLVASRVLALLNGAD